MFADQLSDKPAVVKRVRFDVFILLINLTVNGKFSVVIGSRERHSKFQVGMYIALRPIREGETLLR